MKPSTWTPRSLLGGWNKTETRVMQEQLCENKRIEYRYQFCSLHFDKIPIFQNHIGVTLHGGKMAHAVVNRYTSWKSNSCKRWTVNEEAEKAGIPACCRKCRQLLTFLHFFFLLEDFPNFFHDVSISLLTQAEHGGPCHSCLHYHLQGTCGRGNWNSPKVLWRLLVFFVTSFSCIGATHINE